MKRCLQNLCWPVLFSQSVIVNKGSSCLKLKFKNLADSFFVGFWFLIHLLQSLVMLGLCCQTLFPLKGKYKSAISSIWSLGEKSMWRLLVEWLLSGRGPCLFCGTSHPESSSEDNCKCSPVVKKHFEYHKNHFR